MSSRAIRIGCGQGFWGDSVEAPVRLVEDGPLDYLMLDYLAEVTMSVLAKQHRKRPEAGFARDFVGLVSRIAPTISAKGIKVIANAGGVNPQGCAEAVRLALSEVGLADKLSIAVVAGDDLRPQIVDLIKAGQEFKHFETAEPLGERVNKIVSANAYIGAEGVVEALRAGADIIICGRVADPMMALAPLVYEFGWSWDDWDRLAAGVVAGHIIECGAQATGGNYLGGWETVSDLDRIGYPIVEVERNGSFVVTKHEGSGGLVSRATVTEQLVYEIGDPTSYITPDVIADFTQLKIEELSTDRVKISGVKGRQRPKELKLSISYDAGFTASGTLLYSWPDAEKKAQFAGELVMRRLEQAGYSYSRKNIELIGVNACHGALSENQPSPELAEVMLRIAVFSEDRAAVERFTREVSPLVLNGPPSATSYFGSRGDVKDVYAYWPSLVNRELVKSEVRTVR